MTTAPTPTSAIAEALDQIGRAIETLRTSYAERGSGDLANFGVWWTEKLALCHGLILRYEESVARRAKEEGR